MAGNRVPAIIRTAVPAAVGGLVAWLTARGINVPADTREWADSTLTVAAGTAYYSAVRWIEARVPWAGWLLGYASQPTYSSAPAGRHEQHSQI